ncbi:MAG: hypothetical protein P0Y49_14450 [Candidatus Pedobacter colombiensis]|uniref:Tetratricopeptide repeat protein n=1 Tax=Candidatus Pedobacter colombiensis TaxID=3121371 RepID=A0AAJ5W4N6_9SPHI|nr:hypothetical protein [Pedobacter sp.]WEK17994.1 MAG: hypothetical protein P0Y49_14450 [Pedobacter sp.]
MNTLTKTLTLALVAFSLNTFAQSATEKFQMGMKKGLEMLESAKGTDGFSSTANYFDRVAQAEVKQWTPFYYAGYSNLIAGLTTTDKAIKDQYLDKALSEIDKADALSPDNSEIYALKGYVQYIKLSIDPQSRLAMMSASAASLAKAKALNPENPRIYLISGQNIFYTPEAFGGGKAKAKSILETASAKFAIFKPATPIEPNWGADRAKELLAQIK